MFRKLLHRLRIRPSPSLAFEDAGRRLTAKRVRDIEQGVRETEGMTWDERARYILENTSPEMLAHAEGVARRSFFTLYEDEEDEQP